MLYKNQFDNVAADGAFVYCCRILVWYNYLILNSILNVTYKLLWFVFTASDLCSSVVKLYRLYLLVLVVASEWAFHDCIVRHIISPSHFLHVGQSTFSSVRCFWQTSCSIQYLSVPQGDVLSTWISLFIANQLSACLFALMQSSMHCTWPSQHVCLFLTVTSRIFCTAVSLIVLFPILLFSVILNNLGHLWWKASKHFCLLVTDWPCFCTVQREWFI